MNTWHIVLTLATDCRILKEKLNVKILFFVTSAYHSTMTHSVNSVNLGFREEKQCVLRYLGNCTQHIVGKDRFKAYSAHKAH